MAGALSFLASGWEGFGYYFSHWNSDPFSIGCVIVLALVLSGYFYGCIFRNLVKPLKNIDCTLIGICFILALFQALVFFLIATVAAAVPVYLVERNSRKTASVFSGARHCDYRGSRSWIDEPQYQQHLL